MAPFAWQSNKSSSFLLHPKLCPCISIWQQWTEAEFGNTLIHHDLRMKATTHTGLHTLVFILCLIRLSASWCQEYLGVFVSFIPNTWHLWHLSDYLTNRVTNHSSPSRESAHLTLFFFFFFPFIFICWRLITLQYCSGFCHTLTWISHGFTCVPHPDPPSHLHLHPIPYSFYSLYTPLLELLPLTVETMLCTDSF